MKSIYVKDIYAGNKINSTFLVAEKNMAVSQKGSPYLNLRLKDRTGEIDGRVWDSAVEFGQLFNKGDVIDIQSRAVSYKDAIQLSISKLMKVDDFEIDPSDFLPTSGLDLDGIFEDLMKFVEKINTPCLK